MATGQWPVNISRQGSDSNGVGSLEQMLLNASVRHELGQQVSLTLWELISTIWRIKEEAAVLGQVREGAWGPSEGTLGQTGEDRCETQGK